MNQKELCRRYQDGDEKAGQKLLKTSDKVVRATIDTCSNYGYSIGLNKAEIEMIIREQYLPTAKEFSMWYHDFEMSMWYLLEKSCRKPMRELAATKEKHIKKKKKEEQKKADFKEVLKVCVSLNDPMVTREITEAMNCLEERRKTVLRKRIGLENEKIYTMREIAKEIGVTPERVRQIEARALRDFSRSNKKMVQDLMSYATI